MENDVEVEAPVRVEEPTPGTVDEATLDAIEAELVAVEGALRRLGDGTYGRCETCGETLSAQQLELSPTARHCRAHLPLATT